MPEQVTAQVNRAVANESEVTRSFATKETEKIFEQKLQKDRSKVKYALDEDELPDKEVGNGEVVTIKRQL
jgi:hypothetical protein